MIPANLNTTPSVSDCHVEIINICMHAFKDILATGDIECIIITIRALKACDRVGARSLEIVKKNSNS